MTNLEILFLIILIGVVIFALYYFFRGSRGHISLSRPVESRVDEYLDRRFKQLAAEWALVRAPDAERFTREHEPGLAKAEGRVAELGKSDEEITGTLDQLEARFAALEKEIGTKTKR